LLSEFLPEFFSTCTFVFNTDEDRFRQVARFSKAIGSSNARLVRQICIDERRYGLRPLENKEIADFVATTSYKLKRRL